MASDIYIKTTGSLNEEDSYQLQRLSESIERELRINPQVSRIQKPGEKTFGLVEAIAISNLALTTISTFLAVLQYWKSINGKFSIKYKVGEIEVNIENLTEKEFEEKVIELSKNNPSAPHEVSLNT